MRSTTAVYPVKILLLNESIMESLTSTSLPLLRKKKTESYVENEHRLLSSASVLR